MSYKDTKIQSNNKEIMERNSQIDELISLANSLADITDGGVNLPPLINEGTSADLISGK
jgi:hypothetical protein